MERRQRINAGADRSESLFWLAPRGILAGLLAGICLIEVGFDKPVFSPGMIVAWKTVLLGGLWVFHGVSMWVSSRPLRAWRGRLPELALLLLGSIATFISTRTGTFFIGLLIVVIFAQTYMALAQLVIRYNLLFITSFIVLIVVGALMLRLPRATPPENPISALDALFTSTSAVCVTGLIVRDTATEFTRFGQTIILVLIQLGGLGIIIFGALLATMLSGSMSVKQASSIQEAVTTVQHGPGNVESLVRFVVIATLLTEAIGAMVLYFGWYPHSGIPGMSPGEREFNSIFISISAFCNAGFAPFSHNLEDFRYHWTAHGVVLPLIVLGGLGFPVLFNLWEWFVCWARVRLKRTSRRDAHRTHLIRLNLHTRVVLTVTAVMYLFGTGGVFLGQMVPYIHEASGLNVTANAPQLPPITGEEVGRRVLDASFMSVTARTAGFNTINMDELTATSRFVLMLSMWVGGSPGGTAGGVKTTVVAVLFLTIIATLRNREETEIFGRSVPETLIRRAGALVMLGFVVVSLTTMLLTATETFRFAHHVFEAISATSTVGLSMGLTPHLTSSGRLTIILAMFLGRVGPLVMLGAVVFRRTERARYRYPAEPVILG